MSRIPPASVRVTCNTLDFSEIGTSVYYFTTQLKNNIALTKAIAKLGKNLGFPISALKRRLSLPQLILGVLPIYTQLRASKYYNLLLAHSHHWFSSKLFRGAQSRLLHYHNAAAFQNTRSQCAAELKKNVSTPARALQHTSCNPLNRRLFPKPCKHLNRSNVSNLQRKKVETHVHKTKAVVQLTKHHMSIIHAAQKRALVVLSKLGVNVAPPVPQSFRQRLKSGGDKARVKIPERPRENSWSNAGLFTLFCIQQIVGKQKHRVSNNHIAFQQASLNDRFDCRKHQHKKRFKKPYDFLFIERLGQEELLQIQAGHHYPKSTVSHLKADPFFVSDLSSSLCSPLEKAKAREIKQGLQRPNRHPHLTQGPPLQEQRQGEQRALPPKGRTKGKVGGDQKQSQPNPLEGRLQNTNQHSARFGNAKHHQPSKNGFGLQIDNLGHIIKNNVNPKFWVFRTFNTHARLNFLNFVEGRFCSGPKQSIQNVITKLPFDPIRPDGDDGKQQDNNTVYQKEKANTSPFREAKASGYINKAGLHRLNTGFVFDLSLSSKKASKSLRPTISIRF